MSMTLESLAFIHTMPVTSLTQIRDIARKSKTGIKAALKRRSHQVLANVRSMIMNSKESWTTYNRYRREFGEKVNLEYEKRGHAALDELLKLCEAARDQPGMDGRS